MTRLCLEKLVIKMSDKTSSKREEKTEREGKDKKIINFRLTTKQEEMLDYNINKLKLAKNRTNYFVNKITEDYQTQGKGYKPRISNEYITKADIQELETNLFNRLQNELQNIHMMAQSIIERGESLEKEQKLAKIEQYLFSYNGLAKLDTYDKLEEYLIQIFPEWEADLREEKIYYDLVYKFLQQDDIKYNKRLKKLIWSVPKE